MGSEEEGSDRRCWNEDDVGPWKRRKHSDMKESEEREESDLEEGEIVDHPILGLKQNNYCLHKNKEEYACSRYANKTINDEITWDYSKHGCDNHNNDNSYSRCRQLDSRESRNSQPETSQEKYHDGSNRHPQREKSNRETARLRKYSRERDEERDMTRGREERELESKKYREIERIGRNKSRDMESYGYIESRRNIDDDDRFSNNPNYEKQSRSFRDTKKNKENRDDDEEEYQERVALQLVDQEVDDLHIIKEESRKRRQAILDKYKIQQLKNDDVGQVSQEVVVASKPFMVRNEKDVADQSFVLTQFGVSAPKSDMFCDDIFGDSPVGVCNTGKEDGLAIERKGRSLHDNWDDEEGYYSFRLGEVLDGRYEVVASHGKGVFSTVVRAKDLKPGSADPQEVAIKIIRNNEHMHKAGKEELVILEKLVGAHPGKQHCVRFLSYFKYRNHLCLVFESLNMNLRELLKKFGRNIGLNLTAVRLYSKQLFIALEHLRNCGVLHSDIKPDNVLVNKAKSVLKLCDFGNAMFVGKNEITPYLVSRFYRSPEIILGLPYDHPLDIWSVGCCIFELYSGKVLFPGATNNDMLRLHMELKGLFPKKMLRKGAFTDQHFDQDLNFLAIEEDPVTKKIMRRVITIVKPKDIGARITGSHGEVPKMMANFKDLLEKIFILDPDKRLTVSEALSHPFITGG